MRNGSTVRQLIGSGREDTPPDTKRPIVVPTAILTALAA